MIFLYNTMDVVLGIAKALDGIEYYQKLLRGSQYQIDVMILLLFQRRNVLLWIYLRH